MDARFPRQDLIKRVQAIGAKHGSITLRNWDAERFITHHLRTLPDRSLIYCDPPYFHKSERLYPDHYAPHDHARIACVIQSQIEQPWLVSYDYTPEISHLYTNRRTFTYRLQYNAANVYKGKELIIRSDKLRLPSQSILPFIDTRLRSNLA